MNNKIFPTVVSVLFFGTLLPILAVVFQIFSLMVTTPSSYFFYHDVVPYQEVFERNEYIRFTSIAEFKKPGLIVSYNDILYCDNSEGIRKQYSAFLSQRTVEEKRVINVNVETPSSWRYEGALPNYNTICNLESEVRIHLPFGFTKLQTIIGRDFKINGMMTTLKKEIKIPSSLES